MDYGGREDFNNSLLLMAALGGLWMALSGIWLLCTSLRLHDFVPARLLPARQVERYWRTSPETMVRGWQQAVNGAAQASTIGLQGNVANAIAALFIACGQDAACVVEATTSLTRIERTPDGDLYASVTLPNLIVGTVGGGTYLPTAQECLGLLGCIGTGKASKLAEICAVVALAGELAIVGAMASGNFASAHAAAGRRASPNGGAKA